MFDVSCIFHQCVQLSLVHHKWSVWILLASVSLAPSCRMTDVNQVKTNTKTKQKQKIFYISANQRQ